MSLDRHRYTFGYTEARGVYSAEGEEPMQEYHAELRVPHRNGFGQSAERHQTPRSRGRERATTEGAT